MAEAEGSEILDIEDGDELYRRLVLDHLYPDGTVNSNAFKESGRPRSSTPRHLRLSVDLAKRTTAEQAVVRARKGGSGLGVLVAREPRIYSLTVRHDPEIDNRAHSVIEGYFVRETCRRLAEATTVLIQPARS